MGLIFSADNGDGSSTDLAALLRYRSDSLVLVEALRMAELIARGAVVSRTCT